MYKAKLETGKENKRKILKHFHVVGLLANKAEKLAEAFKDPLTYIPLVVATSESEIQIMNI